MMSLLAWLGWTMLCGALASPVQRAVWWAEIQPEDRASSFHQLPMFQHAPGPLLAPELLRPMLHKTSLPSGLTALLLPSTGPQLRGPETDARGVEVWCDQDKVSVRVDRVQLREWPVPSLFRLGSCMASRSNPRFLYFTAGLTECAGKSKVVGGQLVYTFTLHYTPPAQGHILRMPWLYLPIHCHYNRFHYSYKVGFSPQVPLTTFMRSISSKSSFSLTVCNAQWQPIHPGQQFFLGQSVYFVAQTGTLLTGERLYIDSCYATSSREPQNMSRVDIITDNGCMTDSKRDGSSSHFLFGGESVLKFSVDAFLFKAFSEELYLHCSMSVGLSPSLSSKSCSYNQAAGRWEELVASPSVCSCCDFICSDTHHPSKNMVSSVGLRIGPQNRDTAQMRPLTVLAKDGHKRMEEEMSVPLMTDMHHKQAGLMANSFLTAEDRERTYSLAVSLEGETEEVVMEETDGQWRELTADETILSEQFRQRTELVQAMEDVSSFMDGSVSDRSTSDTTSTTRDGHFSIDYKTTNPSSVNVSTAVVPITCSNSEEINCSNTDEKSTSFSSVHGAIDTATSVESFNAHNDGVASDSSRPDSLRDSKVRTGIHSAREDDTHSGMMEVKKSETVLWLEQLESDSVLSKGIHEGDEFHRPHIRGLESHQSVCVDGNLCGSGVVFGSEDGEAIHANQFVEELTEKEWQGFYDPMIGEHIGLSVSDGSEQVQQDNNRGAAVGTVDSDHKSQSFDKWAKGFVSEQHREIEDEIRWRLMEDLF